VWSLLREAQPELERELGTCPDWVIARRCQVPVEAVRMHRIRLGIPAEVNTPEGMLWRRIGMFLGRVPDAVLSRRYRVDVAALRARRDLLGIPEYLDPRPWTAAELDLLGTKTDSALAQQLNRPPAEIGRMRRACGIREGLGQQRRPRKQPRKR
jgi:hypothetical protein